MASSQKTVKVTKANRLDGAYDLPATDGDEFGKRKGVDPEKGSRKKVEKAGAMGKEEGAKGMPGASGASEDAVFKKAYARISELNTKKSGKQDF